MTDGFRLDRRWLLAGLLAVWWGPCAPAAAQAPSGDPLQSWNDGPTKQAIVTFVGRVTRDGTPSFVPQAESIAVFDNDGTLWAEQPLYVQLAFALDEVRPLAPLHPDWTGREPFRSVLDGDMKRLTASGEKDLLEMAGGHGSSCGLGIQSPGGERGLRRPVPVHRQDRQCHRRDVMTDKALQSLSRGA